MSKLIIISFTLFLLACHPSPEYIKKVNLITFTKKDKTINCENLDGHRCAIETPLKTLLKQSQLENNDYVTLLEKGEDSLMLRLHMIKAAQKSIDIQTFIWVNDDAGHLVLSELLKAAKRGVKVRIIIDQLFSMGNTWFLAELATLHENMTIKMFNPIFNEGHTSAFDFFSALTCCLSSLNRRMHNKLFLIDDAYGINGGRNYQDRYFDWDVSFNYRDREALAIGNVADEMKSSFKHFWDSRWVVKLENLDDVASRIVNNQEKVTKWETPQNKKARDLNLKSYDYNTIKKLFVDSSVMVDSVEYFSDSPEKLFVRDRKIRKQYKEMSLKIKELILSAEKTLILQTPYLVLSRKAYRALRSLRRKKPQINFKVSTNSLSSTDAYYVYAISFKHKRRYLKNLKLNIFEYKNKPIYWKKMFDNGYLNKKTKFGLHAKSIVIDNYTSLIGSHNFDHRSDVLNTESGFIIRSTEIANSLALHIETDMANDNSWLIAPNKKIPVLSFFSGIIATASRALPIMDIWPFRYSSSFELKKDKQAVSINHPDFYKNYKNLGSFPEVDLSSKQIQTIIISAFAGFAEPVM